MDVLSFTKDKLSFTKDNLVEAIPNYTIITILYTFTYTENKTYIEKETYSEKKNLN